MQSYKLFVWSHLFATGHTHWAMQFLYQSSVWMSKPTALPTDFVNLINLMIDKYTFSQTSQDTQDYTSYFTSVKPKYTSTQPPHDDVELTDLRCLLTANTWIMSVFYIIPCSPCEMFWSSASHKYTVLYRSDCGSSTSISLYRLSLWQLLSWK